MTVGSTGSRHLHIVAYAEYAASQVAYAASASADHKDMYERVTIEFALSRLLNSRTA